MSLKGGPRDDKSASQEVFTVSSVSKQSRKGSGNVSYLYGLKRANGQEKEGRYHREQLQIVPEMRTEWNPRRLARSVAPSERRHTAANSSRRL